MKSYLYCLLAGFWSVSVLQAQHVHIAAGAVSTAQNSKLIFANGGQFVTNSGYVLPLDLGDPLYPNLYQGAGSFTALPATIWTGGPVPNHAAPGSYLQLVVESVTGPSNGNWSFYQESEDGGSTQLQFSVPTGTLTNSNIFNLSEGIVDPEPDPFGHIHGRRFTADKPGLYTVGFRIIDTSTAGTNGGPIHTPSDPFYLHFQAGFTINSFVKSNRFGLVTFGSRPNQTFYLEATTNLPPTTNWTVVAGPLSETHSELHTFIDAQATVPMKFYRLRATRP